MASAGDVRWGRDSVCVLGVRARACACSVFIEKQRNEVQQVEADITSVSKVCCDRVILKAAYSVVLVFDNS